MCQHDKSIFSRTWDTSEVACQRLTCSLNASCETTATCSPEMLHWENWHCYAWVSLPFRKETFKFYLKWASRNRSTRFASLRDLFRVTIKASTWTRQLPGHVEIISFNRIESISPAIFFTESIGNQKWPWGFGKWQEMFSGSPPRINADLC